MMKKKELLNLVNRPEMILGIYNYCDRWCERCDFTNRCANFAIGEENFSKSGEDSNNKAFWDELHNVFQLTMEMILESAEKHGIDLNDIDTEKYEEERKQLNELTNAHECAYLSKDYYTYVNDWFDATEDLIEEKKESWKTNARIGLSEDDIVKEVGHLNDIIDVIRWYQYQIHVKLKRAIHGKLDDANEPPDEYPKDSDGFAKVALIGMDRSIAAWGKMLPLFPIKEDVIFKILVLLEKLKRRTEKEFLDARSFVRAGFDD